MSLELLNINGGVIRDEGACVSVCLPKEQGTDSRQSAPPLGGEETLSLTSPSPRHNVE